MREAKTLRKHFGDSEPILICDSDDESVEDHGNIEEIDNEATIEDAEDEKIVEGVDASTVPAETKAPAEITAPAETTTPAETIGDEDVSMRESEDDDDWNSAFADPFCCDVSNLAMDEYALRFPSLEIACM